ncbi:MAG: hypothetical protein AB7V16_07160 [Vulcanibacillus sp.]
MGYAEMYKDKEYCLSELREARRIFTTKPFTTEKGDLLMKGLALMLFHCPDSVTPLVEATIYECERRSLYATIGGVEQLLQLF